MTQNLTIVCPVYNEESVISDFYKCLSATLKPLKNKYNISTLFVIDKSTDDTYKIVSDLADNDSTVKVLLSTKRFGHQMSLVAGIDHALDSIIVMMDSDLQHPPEIIPKMLSQYENGFEVVYTVRTSTKEQGFIRSKLSNLFYSILNLVSEVTLNTGEADFRLISPTVAKIFQNQIRERNQFLRGLFKWVGFNSIAINFTANERKAGMTKYKIGTMMQFASTGIVSFTRKPLQYAIYIGILLSLFSFLIGLHTFISYIFTSTIPSGWTTITIMLSLFSGIQLLFLGIIGEYIGSIFDEVKNRPLYIVEKKINLN